MEIIQISSFSLMSNNCLFYSIPLLSIFIESLLNTTRNIADGLNQMKEHHDP